ncbi:RHS repeat-associated core domain-containing protein [Streptomyces sp. NPDC048208]|uniref:RHS repeat-associated core domain-containing protein n=1 Tax=Streptomyces sp. NPDC048208 TaxID=3365515 RepID=UPI0037241075
MDATTDASGSAVLQLSDVHGSVTAQIPLDTARPAVAQSYDEYGNPEGDTTAARYGWLGAAQRSADSVTEAVLMGVRLYDPTAGRFLSVDPVLGGNDDAYVYPADPVNQLDLDGRASRKPASLSHKEKEALENKANGRRYDAKAYKSAKKKLEQAEKYAGSRNQQKNRSQSDSLRVVLKAIGLWAFIIAIVVTAVVFWEVDIVAAVLWALA